MEQIDIPDRHEFPASSNDGQVTCQAEAGAQTGAVTGERSAAAAALHKVLKHSGRTSNWWQMCHMEWITG
jgi:hypothetical protein